MFEKIENRLIVASIFLVIWILLLSVPYNKSSASILYASIMILGSLLILRCVVKINYVFGIFLFFMIKYFYVLRLPLLYDMPISSYNDFNGMKNFYYLGLTILPFLIGIYYSIYISDKTNIIRKYKYDNAFLFKINYIFACFCWLVGKYGENIFESGGYGLGERGGSSLYEYGIIFFIAAFIFSGNKKKYDNLLVIYIIIFVIKDLLYGGRISSVQIILAYFILFLRYKQYRLNSICVFFVAGYFFFSIYGAFRGDVGKDFTSIAKNYFKEQFDSSKLAYSHDDANVLYAGSRLVGITNNGYITSEEKIKSLGYFILSIVVPYSYLPQNANLACYKSDFFLSGGGGLITGYFYVYGSYLFIFLIAIYIGFCVSKLDVGEVYSFSSLYGLLLVTNVPRWFAYNPIGIFKYSLCGAIYITVMIYYHKAGRKMVCKE